MIARTIFAAATLAAALASAAPAFAGVVLAGREYPDSEIPRLQQSCAGLQAQANTSLTTEVPDDVYSGDPSSAYQLSGLPFDLRDCKRAGLL